jgi:hypothetical protein
VLYPSFQPLYSYGKGSLWLPGLYRYTFIARDIAKQVPSWHLFNYIYRGAMLNKYKHELAVCWASFLNPTYRERGILVCLVHRLA